jgi:hypothetical protein
VQFKNCLNIHYRGNWTPEGISRAQYWYSQVLTALGMHEAAAKELQSARAVKDSYLQQCPEFLHEVSNEAAVYDQMVPMWILQTSGPLQEGGRRRRLTACEPVQPVEGDTGETGVLGHKA